LRIFSRFHDYYDGVVAFGHDNSLTYVRKTARIDDKRGAYHVPDLSPGHFTHEHWLVPGVLGFCGQLYPLVFEVSFQAIRPFNSLPDDQDVPAGERHWSIDTIMPEAFRSRQRKWMKNSWALGWGLSLEQFFTHDFSALSGIFAQHHVPVWLCYRRGHDASTLILNPELKSLGFVRLKPPFECFQAIESYLSGVLGASKEVTEIPDEYRAQAHGFDKWSFRRPPGTA